MITPEVEAETNENNRIMIFKGIVTSYKDGEFRESYGDCAVKYLEKRLRYAKKEEEESLEKQIGNLKSYMENVKMLFEANKKLKYEDMV